MKKQRRAFLGTLLGALAVALLFGIPWLASFWVDLRFFEELGHPEVLLTPLWAKLGLGLGVGAAFFAILLGSLRLASRSRVRKLEPIVMGPDARPVQLDLATFAARLSLPLSLGTSFVAGLVGAQSWRELLLFLHAGSFGRLDPVFSRDVGFYVFTLPLLEHLYRFLMVGLVVTLLATAAVYVARGAFRIEEGRVHALRMARAHLSGIGAAIFLVLAFGAWLASARLVVSQDGLVAGAGYADVHAALPMIRAHIAIAVVGAVMVALSTTRKRLVLVWAAVGLYVATGLLGRGVYPTALQAWVVEPNELERERPYIEHEIESTREAYGLTNITTRELSGEVSLSWENVQQNRATIDNVRLWDHRPLLDTFGQIQEIRTYYDFESVDNDRYLIDGQLRQMMLSPRELSSASLPNRTWINEHLTFTHGYGLTLGPVNEATAEGLPVLFVQDIPPESTLAELRVERPQIYFGELSSNYVFVHTSNREFDHPAADENVYRDYDGPAGIALGSAAFRAALAFETGSFQVLLSDDLSAGSRVLLHRRVTERVALLAPFLSLDGDPYLVVREDGTLAWIVDAYTTTSRYPYSRSVGGGIAYMRNSVKAIVDAYTGEVTLYIADANDPILATWRGIFPSLFTPLADMPADLRAHLRHPIDLFHVQAQMLTTFHMDSPELLYNREDQWQIPSLRRGQTTQPMEPYYTVMRLPGEAEAEFILMLPYTPARKDNLAAWMVARSDGDHLGELVVYEFPNDRLVYGPQQVLNRINQDATISAQLSLWDQRGSQADTGTLLVIPIEESLIYVLPLYLRSEGGRIPQLKRVIVVYENQIAMRETLDAAIAEVFGQGADGSADGSAEGPSADVRAQAEGETQDEAASEAIATPSDTDPRVRAMQSFERAVSAQRRGDWAAYGEELERLGEALRALQPESAHRPHAADPSPDPSPVPNEAPAPPGASAP